MKILFTSVGRRVELIQCFKKSAQNAEIKLEIYGSDIDINAPALYFCDKKVISPRIKSDEYIPFLMDLCINEKINAIIPTIDTDLYVLAENKEAFENIGIKIVVSMLEIVKCCRDKRLTYQLFKSVGFNSPEATDCSSEYKGPFPALIKPYDGSSSINIFKIDSYDSLDCFKSIVPNYIIQPFIDGEEYTVDCFCDFKGNPIFITPRKRLAVRSGEVLKTEIVQDKTIIEEIKYLLKKIRFCGPVTFQLIKEKCTKMNWYIEINARFGGGAPLSINAGADSALALIKLLNGEVVKFKDKAAEDGAVFSRFDQCIRIK